MSGKARTIANAAGGLIAAFASLCTAELAAAAVRPEAGPVTAVGGAVVDRTPAAVKDFAVRTFGTADKLVLQLGILALLAVFALAVGLLSARHRRIAALLVFAFGALGAWAAVSRPEGLPLDALPSLLGGAAGTGVLLLLTSQRVAGRTPAPKPGTRPSPAAEETDTEPWAGPDATPGNVGSPDSAPARSEAAGSTWEEHLPAAATHERARDSTDPASTHPETPQPRNMHPHGTPTPGPAPAHPDAAGPAHPDPASPWARVPPGAERAGTGGTAQHRTRPPGPPAPLDAAQPSPPPLPAASEPSRTDAPEGTGATDHPDTPDTPAGSTPAGQPPTPHPFNRRAFVLTATTTLAASAGAGLLGRHLNSGRQADAAAARSRITLPSPADPARPVPAGAELRVPGLSPLTTPNRDFYRVDTALVVPRPDPARWRLTLHGLGIAKSLTYTYEDLLRRPLIERDITLTCVSNQVGGPYVGNARWLGVRLADLLREAGVRPPSQGGPADQLVARSVDGMTLGSPVETVLDGRDALLAVGMNGEPLPFDHGFPVRMLVPGLYGYVSACKWLRDLELTTFDAFDAYWVRRDWAREAPIKTQSRIDTPRPFASPKAGRVMVAGVAWAQHRGIARVEVRVDGGPWQDASLAAENGRDTWRQWSWPWQAAPGNHSLEVRATDREGDTQTERRVGTVPDGATGLHSVVVAVT
ncbi:molybdopterin-dependent oxidoreductase [Streptomyces sp. NPDC087440]|uniref:molybdopterin-dependent oxidoreductase n=1 Tax=Streptomyces sp. NPDC087440 TaxID=3365790 RepID=UPI003818D74E